jgi:hypothetical protein
MHEKTVPYASFPEIFNEINPMKFNKKIKYY